MRRMYKSLLRYSVLTVIGIVLYKYGAEAALAERGYHAIGGEIFFLFIPFLAPLFQDVLQGIKATVLNIPREEEDDE